MTGIETDAVLFHGVDRGWMQAQWRDCRDKAAQLAIFRDMVGRNVPPQEILDAVGEPEYCGPMEPVKREYRRWTPEDDARIAEMAAEGMTDKQIADALEAVAETLRALLDEEEMLCARCKVVGEMIDRYRARLKELLAMAGGGLTDGKDQI